jgi:hypothetical protein
MEDLNTVESIDVTCNRVDAIFQEPVPTIKCIHKSDLWKNPNSIWLTLVSVLILSETKRTSQSSTRASQRSRAAAVAGLR